MKKIFLFIVLSFIFALIFQTCKRNTLSNSKKANKKLPGYYDIPFDSIFSSEDNYISPEIRKIVTNYYNYFWKRNNLSGGFIIAKGNTIILEDYIGYANKDKNWPITSDTPIHLASISKNLTSMVILKLIEANKIKLNQPVSSILKSFPYNDITIFDLLTHRSGLGDYSTYAETEGWWDKNNHTYLTNKAILRLFEDCKPNPFNPPNTHFSYSNTNYVFLALIIEKITKMHYSQAMKKMIFDPLGMTNTFVFKKKHFNTVSLSYYNNGKKVPWDYRDLVYGDKNIYSTPRDMLKYSQAMFSKHFLRKSLLDSAFMGYSNERKGIKNYGFGIRMLNFKNGKKLIFHNGWWHGNNTVFVRLLDKKVTIIALGNQKSSAYYSAFSLSSIFDDYPIKIEDKDSINNIKKDTLGNDIIKLIK